MVPLATDERPEASAAMQQLGGRSRARWERLWRLLCFERGLLFWLPGALVGSYFVLFGVRQAPADFTLFTHARELRVVVGPVRAADAATREQFTAGLRMRLQTQREISVVDPKRVQQRLDANVGSGSEDALRWIRASRSLKAKFYVSAILRPRAGGQLQAEVCVWEAVRERSVAQLRVEGSEARALGVALGDSLSQVFFRPSLQTSR